MVTFQIDGWLEYYFKYNFKGHLGAKEVRNNGAKNAFHNALLSYCCLSCS
jgi:hypothetical protein